MRLLTAAEQRRLDALAFEVAGLPTRALMESAGAAVAREVLLGPHARVLILCGPGNNGGDGFVAARFLREALPLSQALRDERVVCACPVAVDALKGDARSAWQAWSASGGRTLSLQELDEAGPLRWLSQGDAVVDAVFGCGLSRSPQGAEGAAIGLVNEAGARGARVVAVDLPSGLDADTGAMQPIHVARADVTVTFHLPKRGLVLYPGAASVGRVVVAPIGLPRELETQLLTPACELLDEAWARGTLEPRPMTAHKYDFGHVLALAGSSGKSGAAALLCEAAMRAGAGLVTLAARPDVLAAVLPGLPEVMGFALAPPPGDPQAPLGLADLGLVREALKGKTAVAIGPGLSRGKDTGVFIGELLAGLDAGCAAVVDADGLNALAEERERIGGWCSRSGARPVFTPHAREFARLTGEDQERSEGDRVPAAATAAQRFACVLVLKGARTVVAEPDGTTAICAAGNPGMATAGSGDVLAGVIAALLARRGGRGDSAERARLAVVLHALAGDEVAARSGQGPLLASDLVREGLSRVYLRLGH